MKNRNSLLDKIRQARAKYVDFYVDNSFDLSDRIQFLMDVNGIDQKTLAKRLKKNESEVSKWLSGSHNFTIKTLAKIQEVLGDKLFVVCNDEAKEYVQVKMIMYYPVQECIQKSENLKSYAPKSKNNELVLHC